MKKISLMLCMMILLCSPSFAKKAQHVKVVVLAKTTRSWDGSPLPPYKKGTPQITILRITIPPKTKLPIHKHPVINGGVLLKGQLTIITTDHKVLHLKAGDSIVEVVNKWHYGENPGNTPAEIIVFYAGVKGVPITILKNKGKRCLPKK